MDPVYGYEAINVEAQERSPFSLLHWMKRIIGLRRQHPVFGRGSIEFISTPNRKVLTYIRRLGEEVVLCVANLSRTVQPVEIPLGQFAGLTPVEISGQTEFPRIGDQPYMLTLAGYGFYWFKLQHVVVAMTPRQAPALEERHIPTLFAGVVWESMMDGSLRSIIERQALASFVERQRWFGGKARHLESVRFVDWSTLRHGPEPAYLAVIETTYRDGGRERYFLPLAMAGEPEAATLEQHHAHAVVARISGARKGVLFDGLYDDGLCRALLHTVEVEQDLLTRHGRVRGASNPDRPWPVADGVLAPVWRRGTEQSNTSVMFGRSLVMKLFRRLEWGDNPDVEIDRHLTERGFTAVPAFAGHLQYVTHDHSTADVAIVQTYVGNQGSGWHVALEELGRYLERVTVLPSPDVRTDAAVAWIRSADAIPAFVQDAIRTYLVTAEVLGRRTGELHRELAAGTDESFAPEPLRGADIQSVARAIRVRAEEQFAMLADAVTHLSEAQRPLAQRVLDARIDLLADIEELPLDRPLGVRMRCHGDYHLGQILMAEGDVVILDFEGEPARPLADRRMKTSPLRDVAGMLRSFSYAALTALAMATDARPEDRERIQPWAQLWETWVSAVFMRAYLRATAGAGLLPASPSDFDALLRTFIVEKMLYELGYELNHRPDWAYIPLTGLLRLRGSLHA
jgi:maltose alpha-D-glucosyltransferase/alpha-amylase